MPKAGKFTIGQGCPQLKKLLIVKQILLVSSLENAKRTVCSGLAHHTSSLQFSDSQCQHKNNVKVWPVVWLLVGEAHSCECGKIKSSLNWFIALFSPPVESLITIADDPYKAVQDAHALVVCTEWDEFKVCVCLIFQI